MNPASVIANAPESILCAASHAPGYGWGGMIDGCGWWFFLARQWFLGSSSPMTNHQSEDSKVPTSTPPTAKDFIIQDMTFSTPRDALSVIREIFRGPPGKDDPSLKRVQSACRSLQLDMPEKTTKIGELEEWADIYLSQRKWQKKDGGAPQVARWALGICSLLESSLPSGDQSKKIS
jgi:hypothetical protein